MSASKRFLGFSFGDSGKMDIMKESGISLDFDSMMEGDDIADLDDKFYQLQSKPIVLIR